MSQLESLVQVADSVLYQTNFREWYNNNFSDKQIKHDTEILKIIAFDTQACVNSCNDKIKFLIDQINIEDSANRLETLEKNLKQFNDFNFIDFKKIVADKIDENIRNQFLRLDQTKHKDEKARIENSEKNFKTILDKQRISQKKQDESIQEITTQQLYQANTSKIQTNDLKKLNNEMYQNQKQQEIFNKKILEKLEKSEQKAECFETICNSLLNNIENMSNSIDEILKKKEKIFKEKITLDMKRKLTQTETLLKKTYEKQDKNQNISMPFVSKRRRMIIESNSDSDSEDDE